MNQYQDLVLMLPEFFCQNLNPQTCPQSSLFLLQSTDKLAQDQFTSFSMFLKCFVRILNGTSSKNNKYLLFEPLELTCVFVYIFLKIISTLNNLFFSCHKGKRLESSVHNQKFLSNSVIFKGLFCTRLWHVLGVQKCTDMVPAFREEQAKGNNTSQPVFKRILYRCVPSCYIVQDNPSKTYAG